MNKPYKTLTPEEKLLFVRERRQRRAIKTKGEAKALTVAGLAKAWNVNVIELEKKLLTLDVIKSKLGDNELNTK